MKIVNFKDATEQNNQLCMFDGKTKAHINNCYNCQIKE